MTFNSWEFLIFYPIVLLLYFALPKKMKWPMLLVASYFFYMCYQAELVFLIFGTTLVSWVASNIIAKSENKATRRTFLIITLATSLGVLFFYKYFNFISRSIFGLVSLFSKDASPFSLNLILPVGISFYTFQTLSYVIDVYRKEVEPERNFFFYALFVSFFPQLVAGPIERPNNLIPQLKEEHKWSRDNAVKGAKYMMLGFFKKICVADMLAVYVNSVYNSPSEASALGVIIATLMFSVQIYCDFSGYTDIAIGCARIMGIRLMKNFDRPYCATTIKEFWSRWHISLSGWFKDYLYIPLGGSRCKKSRHLFNLFVVFLVSGLWHGAAWTFVIWGALHALYQIVGTLTIKKRNAFIEKLGYSVASRHVVYIRRTITFLLVALSWVFFRANSLSDVAVLFKKLLLGWSVPLSDVFSSMSLNTVSVLTIILACVLLWFFDHMLEYDDVSDSSDVMTSRASFVYVVWIILLCWCLLLSKDMISTFIYFQF